VIGFAIGRGEGAGSHRSTGGERHDWAMLREQWQGGEDATIDAMVASLVVFAVGAMLDFALAVSP